MTVKPNPKESRKTKKRVYNMDSTSTDYTRLGSGVEEKIKDILTIVYRNGIIDGVQGTQVMSQKIVLDEAERDINLVISQAVTTAKKEERDRVKGFKWPMNKEIKDWRDHLVKHLEGKPHYPKDFKRYGISDSLSVQDTGEEKCNVPPEGWYCTRKPGHDGPCAAIPKDSSECECANNMIECLNCANEQHDEHCQQEENNGKK